MQTDRTADTIVTITGWTGGLLAAGWVDYLILPKLAARLGGKAIPIGVGLVVGSVVIYFVVLGVQTGARAWTKRGERSRAENAPRRKTPAEQIPVSSRIMIGLLAVLIAAGMLMGGSGLPVILK